MAVVEVEPLRHRPLSKGGLKALFHSQTRKWMKQKRRRKMMMKTTILTSTFPLKIRK
jgi:hypothetical protein